AGGAGKERSRRPGGPFAAIWVTEVTKQAGAGGWNQNPRREHPEGIEQGRPRVGRREELRADDRGEKAEEAEIVPLQGIADGPRHHRATRARSALRCPHRRPLLLLDRSFPGERWLRLLFGLDGFTLRANRVCGPRSYRPRGAGPKHVRLRWSGACTAQFQTEEGVSTLPAPGRWAAAPAAAAADSRPAVRGR